MPVTGIRTVSAARWHDTGMVREVLSYDHDSIPVRRTPDSWLHEGARASFFTLVATHSGYFTNRRSNRLAQTNRDRCPSRSFGNSWIGTTRAITRTGRATRLSPIRSKVYQASRARKLCAHARSIELEHIKRGWSPWTSSSGTPNIAISKRRRRRSPSFEKEWNVTRDTLPAKQYL